MTSEIHLMILAHGSINCYYGKNCEIKPQDNFYYKIIKFSGKRESTICSYHWDDDDDDDDDDKIGLKFIINKLKDIKFLYSPLEKRIHWMKTQLLKIHSKTLEVDLTDGVKISKNNYSLCCGDINETDNKVYSFYDDDGGINDIIVLHSTKKLSRKNTAYVNNTELGIKYKSLNLGVDYKNKKYDVSLNYILSYLKNELDYRKVIIYDYSCNETFDIGYDFGDYQLYKWNI